MKKPKNRRLVAFCAFTIPLVVSGCIPTEADVSLRGSPILRTQTLADPSQGLAIFGYVQSDEAGNGYARYDGGLAECVRQAITDASEDVRLITEDEFRSAAQGVFANADEAFSVSSLEATLKDASSRGDFVRLGVGYLILISGEVARGDTESSAILAVGAVSHSENIQLDAQVWDPRLARQIEVISTQATAEESIVSIGLVLNFYSYAPTEARACEDVGRRIIAFAYG